MNLLLSISKLLRLSEPFNLPMSLPASPYIACSSEIRFGSAERSRLRKVAFALTICRKSNLALGLGALVMRGIGYRRYMARTSATAARRIYLADVQPICISHKFAKRCRTSRLC